MSSYRFTAGELAEQVQERDQSGLKWATETGIHEIAVGLKTSLDNGLSADEVELKQRTECFGKNVYPEKPPKSFFQLMWEALQDTTLRILIVSAIVSIILGTTLGDEHSSGWIEGTAILLAVCIVVLVTAGNDYSKEIQFRKLNAISDNKTIKVRRAGVDQTLSIFDICVGDVVSLDQGDTIPADGLFISGFNVSCDEASMTGETDLIDKSAAAPFLLSNCKIMEGKCTMLIIAVGTNSQWGLIKAMLDVEQEETPLQEKLNDLADKIGLGGLGAAILTFSALTFLWALNISLEHWEWSRLIELIDFVIIAITIVVVAVPEGLPLAVTISLAYSMSKMMADNNLVRHLAACETMGGATCICSDKTGTLTQNRMTVVQAFVGMNLYDAEKEKVTCNSQVLELLTEGISTNSSGFCVKKNGLSEHVGNKTECALLDFSEKCGHSWSAVRNSATITRMFPFNSTNKEMSTTIQVDGKYRVHKKGAPEFVIKTCDFFLDESSSVQDLTEAHKAQVEDTIIQFSKKGLRTILLCYQDRSAPVDEPPSEAMIFLGLFGIKDPVRPEVPSAVSDCKSAGITVRMVTGDNILTAKHIARECGILESDDQLAIEGPDFRKMSPTQIDEILPSLRVIARASPEDKLILVKRLKENGEVVSSTGDGTNDAPQMKAADVGFSMGITGTEVAKEASDIILLDDNFASIVKAAMWGRNVFDSIRKFLQFQLTVNIVAVATAFLGAVWKGESPLTAVQLLWVNLIMDTMAALALATETPTRELLRRPPHGRFSPLIDNKMWRMIILQAIYQLTILLTLLHKYESLGFIFPRTVQEADGVSIHLVQTTIIFNTFVMCQIFNEINCRKLGNDIKIFNRFFSNSIFVGVMVVTFVTQFLLVEFGGSFSQTTSLSLYEWFLCTFIGFLSIPLGIAIRFVPVPEEKQSQTETQSESLPVTQVFGVFFGVFAFQCALCMVGGLSVFEYLFYIFGLSLLFAIPLVYLLHSNFVEQQQQQPRQRKLSRSDSKAKWLQAKNNIVRQIHVVKAFRRPFTHK